MTYIPNIPQPGDDPSISQDQILNNFQDLNTFLSQNHVSLNDANQGKHTILQMPIQGSAPSTASNEIALYSRTSGNTGNNELVFRRSSDGTLIEATAFLGNTNGWTRLPSGILLKWGTGSGSGVVNVSISSNPGFSAVYSAQITVDDAFATPNSFVSLRSLNPNEMSVYCSSRTVTSPASATFRYLVIGI